MVDVATFLTPLSVMVEAFCKTSLPPACHPGPQATLSRSEGMTWALCGPWQGFGRARGFSRDAQRHLRAAFPQGPSRAPCHRQMRQQPEALRAFCLPLVQFLAAPRCADDALDSSGLPTREAKRRGAGWLPGLADIGWSTRRGWYDGCPLLLAVHPVGGRTGLIRVDFL